MARFTGFVPDHILRNYLVRGKTATILPGAKVKIHQEPRVIEGDSRQFHEVVCWHCGSVSKIKFKPNGVYVEDRPGTRTTYSPSEEQGETWDYENPEAKTVTVVNLLPGYDEVYSKAVHNAKVVWIEGDEYHIVDINETAEVRDGKD